MDKSNAQGFSGYTDLYYNQDGKIKKAFVKIYDVDELSKLQLESIVRHELGHALGFRHEHIRSGAPAACPNETLFETDELTDYDPQSVMHYFCGGFGTTELKISELDKVGSQQLYGQSFDTFNFVSA